MSPDDITPSTIDDGSSFNKNRLKIPRDESYKQPRKDDEIYQSGIKKKMDDEQVIQDF